MILISSLMASAAARASSGSSASSPATEKAREPMLRKVAPVMSSPAPPVAAVNAIVSAAAPVSLLERTMAPRSSTVTVHVA